MLLRMIFVVFASVHSSQGWNVDLSGRFPGQTLPQPLPGVFNNPRCFGLARKTRPQKVTMPLIYNSRTGQSQPFPKYLYTAEHSVIARAEHDGWEVRMKNVYVPRYAYDRVPICCPWEQNCDHGRQVITSPAAEKSGTCANGGHTIYRDGIQRCECAPGYQGMWCQLRVPPGEHQPHANFPSGPLVRMLSAPGPYGDMVREAEMWRSKAKQFAGAPMLPVKGRSAAVTSPWGYGPAAMMQHQIMQAKMNQMEDMYRHAHGNFNNQIPQQPLPLPDVRRNVKMLRGNPYSFADPSVDNKFLSASEANKNPYSTISSQGQLPPDMMRAFYAVQETLKHQQSSLNPYSRASPNLPQHLQTPPLQKVNVEQAGVNPLNSRPPQGRDMPQARTPWDLDPFGQQQSPAFMNYPGMPAAPNRNKQAMAIVLYQQLLNQRNNKQPGRNDSPKHPTVNSASVQAPAVEPVVNVNTQQQQQQQQQQQLQQLQQQQQTLGTTPQEGSTQPQQVTNIPETTSSNVVEQVPMNTQPLAVMPGPIPLYQPQSSSEEMKRIEQCQAVLTPRLSECLADFGLALEQFMNPEYMPKARAVCMSSQSVGQCIMQHDKVCGEGDVVMATRKMINSVLHMMGMICQQISAREETPVMTGPNQQVFMQTPGGDMPLPVPEPLTPKEAVVSVEKVQEPPMINENSQQQGVALPSEQSGMPSDSNSVQDVSEATNASVSKAPLEQDSAHLIRNTEAYNGHDSAQPVSLDLKVLGYPLWLVITVALALFVLLVIVVLVICLCCRRRRRQKSAEANKEIEKMPAHLERVCSIGIPPPSYNTTVLQQNEDSLHLPPLDLNDDEDDVKVPLDDEADDESGDSDGKKTEKKGK